MKINKARGIIQKITAERSKTFVIKFVGDLYTYQTQKKKN
jgi:hypothetical protein